MIVPFCAYLKNRTCQLSGSTCIANWRGEIACVSDCVANRVSSLINIVDRDYDASRLLKLGDDTLQKLLSFASTLIDDDDCIEDFDADTADESFELHIIEKVKFYMDAYSKLPVKDAALDMAITWTIMLRDMHFCVG